MKKTLLIFLFAIGALELLVSRAEAKPFPYSCMGSELISIERGEYHKYVWNLKLGDSFINVESSGKNSEGLFASARISLLLEKEMLAFDFYEYIKLPKSKKEEVFRYDHNKNGWIKGIDRVNYYMFEPLDTSIVTRFFIAVPAATGRRLEKNTTAFTKVYFRNISEPVLFTSRCTKKQSRLFR